MQHISTNGSRLRWTALAGALALALQAQAQAPSQPQAQRPVQPQAQTAAPAGQPGAQAGRSGGSSWMKQQALRASRVIGSGVRNPQGQEIGQIEDMVVNMDTGKVRYAVLRFDPGFLHFERVYAVPVERLRMMEDQVVIDIPRERLEQSGIESAGWSRDYFNDRSRIARLDTNWSLGPRAPEELVRASDLMNTPVVTPTGSERVGRIEELVFAPGREQVQYVVVSFDRGWLGTDKRAALDLGSLHRSSRTDALALVVDRAAVINMRPFTEDRYAYFGDGSFVNRDSRRTLGAAGAAPAR